ncbi:PTPRT [Mytilus coruscus]|uniref:protein-tyrosine-phosphatase n=1 Tax=Mytilus coruscus TaxID=42192 RepID=A0A6J8DYK0_MYTCO|nr:PTPRT [Mytilus coruscus]
MNGKAKKYREVEERFTSLKEHLQNGTTDYIPYVDAASYILKLAKHKFRLNLLDISPSNMLLVLFIHTSVLLTVTAQQNLTKFGQATQSSTQSRGRAQNAIYPPISNDWSFDKCTHTIIGKNPAWWMFQFSYESVYITDITIYYRQDLARRMDGFKLYVTNTSTIPPDGYLCNEDLAPDLPNITQTIPCYELGKYVIYYDDKGSQEIEPKLRDDGPVVELCYVAINGCQKSRWGSTCEKLCAENCIERNCNPENGSCVWGCNPTNCLNNICDKDTAVCTDGCKIRRTGIYCNQYNIASDGVVSQNPSGSQPASRANDGDITTCSKPRDSSVKFQVDLKEISIVTGFIILLGDGTIKEGYHTVYSSNNSDTWHSGTVLYNGTVLSIDIKFEAVFRFLTYVPSVQSPVTDLELCEIGIIGCRPTHYGPLCNTTCPQNCHGPCDLENGNCKFGCMNGWTGVKCEQECSDDCPNGQFGRNCSRFCKGCVSSICDSVNGLCDNKTSCNPGYEQTETCNISCDDGEFGINCGQTCNCLTETCSKEDGICPPGGCKKGWHGKSCHQECNSSKFGRNCKNVCEGCISYRCDSIDGLCKNTTGCEPGYLYEKYCNKTCGDGYYGKNCTGKCKCVTGTCDIFTGICGDGSESRSEEPSNAATIGGGVSAVIILLMIVVVAFIIYKRRLISTKERYVHRKKSTNNTSMGSQKEIGNGNEYANVNIDDKADTEEVTLTLKDREDTDLQIDENGDENVYYNVTSELDISKYQILIENLKNAIIEKQRDDGFKKEYEMLPRGLVYAHVEGSKEENKAKNRFLTTWPYDHSRVILKGDTKHDYINASYIDNYEREKAYIAAQGPKKVTVKDFWHMIWQENVGKIVMVTQLVENRKAKCERYWPKTVTESLVVNNFIVTMKQEREHTVYVYRLLTVLNKNEATAQERTIHHFHFTQWPDHGVPDSIKLVKFYRNVKSEKCNQHGPMLVHCSAGIGRTGTFIAIDALYEVGKKVGHVNIMEYIQMARKDRINMVQTCEQYETVFEALLELFTVPETAIPKNGFCQYISDHEHTTLPRNQNLYKVEFQRLEALRPVYPPSAFTTATLKENISKNSASKIFPHDYYRPYLMSYGKTRNDYINAVIIPGYAVNSKFLVTQCPLEKTVVDFWTMVYDHDSNIIVLLDQLNKNAPLWLEKQEVLEFEHFSILQENASNTEEIQLTLHHKKKDQRIITVFSASKLNVASDTMLPSSSLLDLLRKVNDCWGKVKGSITVVSSDGCTRSGMFVALYLAFEKMEIDDEIDVFQLVRAMQVRRPQFFKELDQYEYCYKCIKEHLEERDSLYANL